MEVGGTPRWVAMSVGARVAPTSLLHIIAAGLTTRLMSPFLIAVLTGLGKTHRLLCMWNLLGHVQASQNCIACAHLCLVSPHPTEIWDIWNSQKRQAKHMPSLHMNTLPHPFSSFPRTAPTSPPSSSEESSSTASFLWLRCGHGWTHVMCVIHSYFLTFPVLAILGLLGLFLWPGLFLGLLLVAAFLGLFPGLLQGCRNALNLSVCLIPLRCPWRFPLPFPLQEGSVTVE